MSHKNKQRYVMNQSSLCQQSQHCRAAVWLWLWRFRNRSRGGRLANGSLTWKLRQGNICSTRRLNLIPPGDTLISTLPDFHALPLVLAWVRHLWLWSISSLSLICLSTCYILLCHFITSGSFNVFPNSIQPLWMISPPYCLLLSVYSFCPSDTFSVSKCSCLNPLKYRAVLKTGHWSASNRWTERGRDL